MTGRSGIPSCGYRSEFVVSGIRQSITYLIGTYERIEPRIQVLASTDTPTLSIVVHQPTVAFRTRRSVACRADFGSALRSTVLYLRTGGVPLPLWTKRSVNKLVSR